MKTKPTKTKTSPTRRRRPNGESGFSMLEILAALTITVIGLMGLMAVQVSAVRGNQAASRLNEATAIGQRTLEDLRSQTMDAIVADFGTMPIADAVMDTANGRANATYNRTLFVTELTAISADLVHIRVEVDWTEQGAVPGSEGGRFDHMLAFEVIRTRQEAL